LRRLQKDDCLITYDEPYQGRNRRYYQITEKGKDKYGYYLKEWNSYKEAVDKLLG
jgi:PadR family transcriptional regulator PadR